MKNPIRLFAFSMILFFVALLTLSSSLNALDKPMNPVIYAGPSGGIELYWFYPGLHNENLGNVRDQADDGFFVSEQDRQFAVLTRFSINPPVFISSVSTYITTLDVFPEYPGNHFTPIGLSLKKRNFSGEFNDYCNQLISLDSGVTSEGARVDCRVDLVLKYDFEFWAGLEWLPGFPTAPLIGINFGPKMLEQYICPMADSNFLLQECNDEYMIGLEVLASAGDNLNDSLFFEVYYSADTNEYFSSAILLDSPGTDSLNSSFEILSDGYLCIVSSDGMDDSRSGYVKIEVDKKPPLLVHPDKIIEPAMIANSGPYVINLQNTGLVSLPIKLNYDRNVLTISTDSFDIGGGENIDIVITPAFEFYEDSVINSSIIIGALEEYYRIIYHLRFTRSEATHVRESSDILPAAFYVGQPQPNPFNTGVHFNLESVGNHEISFDVYNILGQNIYSEVFRSGKNKTIRWEGVSRDGNPISSGIYFFRFATDDYRVYRKALLLK